jgi:hypothetical protein
MVDDRSARKDHIRAAELDTAQFAMAVQCLKEHLDRGMRLPLYYTLPTGRSTDSLCDRLARSPSSIPSDVLPTLHFLADALSVQKPEVTDYQTCAPVVKEIAARLTLPFDQRRLPSDWASGSMDSPPWIS